jgi:hypothetical protein
VSLTATKNIGKDVWEGMTAAEIVEWSIPYVSQLGPYMLVIAVICVADLLIDLLYDIVDR